MVLQSSAWYWAVPGCYMVYGAWYYSPQHGTGQCPGAIWYMGHGTTVLSMVLGSARVLYGIWGMVLQSSAWYWAVPGCCMVYGAWYYSPQHGTGQCPGAVWYMGHGTTVLSMVLGSARV